MYLPLPYTVLYDSDIISLLLQKNPLKRPNACVLQQRPWCKEVLSPELVEELLTGKYDTVAV